MPNFDKTGPSGRGPNTGRGYGPCGLGLAWRKGRGWSKGRGLGRYFGWEWPKSLEEKKEALRDYKKALKEELEDLEREEAVLEKEEE